MHPAPDAWRTGLQVVDIDLDAFACSLEGEGLEELDGEERQRAARMATPLLRDRFVAAHVAMRRLIGAALDVDPGGLRFRPGKFGKPDLATPMDAGLHFNLSHCRGRALLALAADEVGVDVEGWIERDTQTLAGEILAPEELERFRDHLPEDQPRQLARVWAGKEALFKACGLGLQIDPRSVCIEPHDGWHQLPPPAGGTWWLQHLEMEGPFCACVATRRRVAVKVARHG